MNFKKIGAVVCALSVMVTLSGCDVLSNYTSDYKLEKETAFVNSATAWFGNNLPDASDVTYELLTKNYVTDVVHGTFVIDETTYNYAWVEGTETLYTDVLSDGTSYSVCENRFEDLIESMFHEGSVEAKITTSSWSNPCSYYGNSITRVSETESEVQEIVLDGVFDYSYFEWGTTQADMWVWCENVMSRKTDTLMSVTADITYDSYSDIESELKSNICMKAYPALDRMVFRTEGSSDYYTITREDDNIVTEWHHKVEDNGKVSWNVDEV